MSLSLATKGYLGGGATARAFSVSGVARPNASVFIYLDGRLARNVTADASGMFRASVVTVPGSHEIQARQVVAWVTSPLSSVTRFSV
jgi:hypothetical protein